MDNFSLQHLNDKSTYIIPLGGCGEFGMHMFLYICTGTYIIVDCGIMFPPPHCLGIAGIYPQVEELLMQINKIDLYIITHAHEDHIGALNHFVSQFPAPIYMSEWSKEIICSKYIYLEQYIKSVSNNNITNIKINNTEISFIPVNHSIPGSLAIYIKNTKSSILHCSDFKFRNDKKLQIFTQLLTLQQKKYIKNIDVMLVDSTNADLDGFCLLESDITDNLKNLLYQAPQAVFITLFASNAFRLKSIYEICNSLNKKICIIGQSIEHTFNTAIKLNLIPKSHLFISAQDIAFFPRKELVFIVGGCQAEITSSLKRIANDKHKYIHIVPQDMVIFSARQIPGNEYYIKTLIIECMKKEATVYLPESYNNIHASGHAHKEDIKELIKIFNPKAYISIHGTYDKLYANANIAKEMQIKNILIPQNGDIIEINKNTINIINQITISKGYLDEPFRIPLTSKDIKDRINLSTNGVLIIAGIFNITKQYWEVNPTIEIIGLKIPDHLAEEEFNKLFTSEIMNYYNNNIIEYMQNMENLKIKIKKVANNIFGKKPFVIVKIFNIK